MRKHILILTAVFAIFFTGCNNFFHDLIPPDGNEITHFYIHEGQSEVEIGGDYINITVPMGTSLSSMIPAIEVSSGAELLPITREYIQRAFGDETTYGAAYMIYSGGDITEQAINLIQESENFKRPVLDIPIDFSNPVEILVVSALGSVRIYKINVMFDTGEGVFTSFNFEKFYNPELVRSAYGVINASEKTITVNVSYPVENIASYELIPVFQTNNARVYLNEREMTSALSLMEFDKPPTSNDLLSQPYKTQEKKFTLSRPFYDDTIWTLIVNFEEDPDTDRSIIDFRFVRTKNPQISADYMAEITVSDDKNTGTIEVTVYYGNIKPDYLTPDFVSPGIVTVDSVTQISGVNSHDFSVIIQYTVESKINGYIRVYTVIVHLIQATDPLPVISYFSLSKERNKELVSNSTAVIDSTSGIIMIEAAYSGSTPPSLLVPEFSATGTVSSGGVTQISGESENNFSSYVIYTVVNTSNPTLKRDYKVEVIFVQSLSSSAEITSFAFYTVDNSNYGLIANVNAAIDHGTGTITATLLFDTYNDINSGGTHELTPRWSAQGTVETGGVVISSGTDSRYFTDPVELKVVSLDGLLQMNYKVIIKEVNSRIYVNENAAGRNNGTSWQNAYKNLPQACEDAALFPDDTRCELWIAKGRYTPSDRNDIEDFLPAIPNTYYMGGFNGTETNERTRTDMTNRRAVITGDLRGNGTLISRNIFSKLSTVNIRQVLNGDVTFEYLEFKDVSASGGNNKRNGSAINLRVGAGAGEVPPSVTINGCVFENLKSDSEGGAVYIYGEGQNRVNIINSDFKNTSSDNYGGAVYAAYLTELIITDTTIDTASGINYGGAVYVTNITDVNITDCSIKKVSVSGNSAYGGAIYFSNNSGTLNITGTIIEDAHSNAEIRTYDSGSTYQFAYGGAIANGGTLNIIGGSIKNVSANGGDGGAIYSYYGKLNNITGTTIENASAQYGGAIYCPGTLNITEAVIQNAYADYNGGAIYTNSEATINNTIIRNASAGGSGGGIFATSRLRMDNSEFDACVAYRYAGALYAAGTTTLIIDNTMFRNCIAADVFKIMYQNGSAIITNSTFIHDDNLPNIPNSTSSRYGLFPKEGTFEGCAFTNLRTNRGGGDNYIFNAWHAYSSGTFSGGTVNGGGYLYLTDCTFNLDANSIGILALYGGQQGSWVSQSISSNRLYVKGMNINNNGCRQYVIWLKDGNSDHFYFFPGDSSYPSRYNNTILNETTYANLIGISFNAGTGVFRGRSPKFRTF